MSASVLASIPSPGDRNLPLGPVDLHVYGLLLAVAILVGTRIAMARWARRGGSPNDILDVVVVVVIAGVIGARLYHVITDYQRFEGRWWDAVQIWKGGLSIWGAVMGGAVGVLVATRRRGLDTLRVMDAMTPGLLAAQVIGRWGNWFNQELFGRPTSLPWGLEIDPVNRPAGYEQFATFHPVFLYESLTCLVGLGLALWIDDRARWKRGQLFAAYIVYYCAGRLVWENLRIDAAHRILGLRVNVWTSLILLVFGLGWFRWLGQRRDERVTP